MKKIIIISLIPCLLIAAPQYSLRPQEKGAAARVTLQPFLVDSLVNTQVAIIICPGGSYSWLDMGVEGMEVAKWLNQNGINAYVLKYRVASIGAYVTGYRILGLGNKYPDMLTDIEDALKYVYTHAMRDHIDTTMIGVMGFSAGGHLAMSAYAYNRTRYLPRFICPIYPVVTMSNKEFTHKRSRRGALGVWGQWNKTMQDSLSIEKHITNDCPPVFLVNCQDDPVVKYQNSELLDSALTQANVAHQYCQYKSGGHGFGTSDNKGCDECRLWKKDFLVWISNLKASRK